MPEKFEAGNEEISELDINILQGQKDLLVKLIEKLESAKNDEEAQILESEIKSMQESMARREAMIKKILS